MRHPVNNLDRSVTLTYLLRTALEPRIATSASHTVGRLSILDGFPAGCISQSGWQVAVSVEAGWKINRLCNPVRALETDLCAGLLRFQPFRQWLDPLPLLPWFAPAAESFALFTDSHSAAAGDYFLSSIGLARIEQWRLMLLIRTNRLPTAETTTHRLQHPFAPALSYSE